MLSISNRLFDCFRVCHTRVGKEILNFMVLDNGFYFEELLPERRGPEARQRFVSMSGREGPGSETTICLDEREGGARKRDNDLSR